MYCRECGKQIGDSKFCPYCGTKAEIGFTATEPPAKISTINLNNVTCPKCKSNNTHTGRNHDNKLYWICGDCDCNFRDAKTIDEEIKELKKRKSRCVGMIKLGIGELVISVLVLLLSIYRIFEHGPMYRFSMDWYLVRGIGKAMVVISVIWIIVSVVLWFVAKNELDNLGREKLLFDKMFFK